MMNFMEQFVKINDAPLTIQERNLFSTAFKNSVGARRVSWRVVSNIHCIVDDNNEIKKNSVISYCETIKNEMRKICDEVKASLSLYFLINLQSLLDEYLIPKSEDAESKVFYLKMKGDYLRYLAEFENEVNRESIDFLLFKNLFRGC